MYCGKTFLSTFFDESIRDLIGCTEMRFLSVRIHLTCGFIKKVYRNMTSFKFALVFFFLARGSAQTCPSRDEIWPCYCFDGPTVNCSTIYDGSVLIEALRGAEGVNLSKIILHKSRLSSLPPPLFENITVSHLEVTHSSLESVAFMNDFLHLSPSLVSLSFFDTNVESFSTDCDNCTSADFPLFEQLIFNTGSCLISSFGDIHVWVTLRQYDCRYGELGTVLTLPDEFLGNFSELETVNLNRIGLTNIKRNHFPKPALRLKKLDLSSNPLVFLPDDLFEEMPVLENIRLYYTFLTTVNWKTFAPVWYQLKTLYLNNIPLHCDCKVAWLAERTPPTRFGAPSCETPPVLKSKVITMFNRFDLCDHFHFAPLVDIITGS
ncbi:uncharacterized protein LOC143257330 [Tachypleus tridentatus]|uniref:uncharacterized protein LOC143257330 n=1 Tax=Tachypleus tridentatus TaxID=6853 RepID=UPI003FCF73F5